MSYSSIPAFAEIETEPSVFTLPPVPPTGVPGLTRAEIEAIVSEETAVAVAAKLAGLEERTARTLADERAKLERLAAEVRTAGAPRVMGVKFPGDAVPRKLSKEMNPALPAVLNMLKGIRPNVLLVGPKGSGKTTLAEQVAESFGAEYAALTVTAGASETWLLGRIIGGEYVTSKFCDLYERGGVFLLDELDRADANFACMLNTCLENGHFYNPVAGRTMKRHSEFYVVACANTNMRGQSPGYAGASRQDQALVERFFATAIGYDRALEKKLVTDVALLEAAWEAREALEAINSTEAISTRAILTLERALGIGLPMEAALYSVTLGWAPAALQAADLAGRIERNRKAGAA